MSLGSHRTKLGTLLRLSDAEERLLPVLPEPSAAGLTVAQITRASSLPRASVYVGLRSLQDRGLAQPIRRGKRHLWHRTSAADVAGTLSPITGEGQELLSIAVEDLGLTLYRGESGVIKVWEKLLEMPPGTRISVVQPTASIRASLSRLDWQKKVQRLQENILRKRFHMESLLREDYYPFIFERYRKDPKQLRAVLESFIGRPSDTVLIRDTFLNSTTELIILPEAAYITDWEKMVSVEIRNPSIIGFLREMFELARGYGRKIDQNAYLREMLERAKAL